MTTSEGQRCELRKNRRAVSPAISTVILTAAVIVMLLVTVAFANNFLNARMAENEFSSIKQFMQTAGLQIDDVAWTIGRTETIRYASRLGQVSFESVALNYTIYVNDVPIASFTTGIILFSMPISAYNLGNGYQERIVPSTDRSILQKGTSAPVCHIFVIEKVPMVDGNFIRVVVAPSVRMFNSTITTSNTTQNYCKFYLPIMDPGSSPRLSQSVTLVGTTVNVQTSGNVNKVKIHVEFPKNSTGFDNSFFKFDRVDEEVVNLNGSILEFYTGEVVTSLGLSI
jgi:hypothetical protein